MISTAPVPRPRAVVAESPPREGGVAFICKRCDVLGYAGPGVLAVCFFCELSDRLES